MTTAQNPGAIFVTDLTVSLQPLKRFTSLTVGPDTPITDHMTIELVSSTWWLEWWLSSSAGLHANKLLICGHLWQGENREVKEVLTKAECCYTDHTSLARLANLTDTRSLAQKISLLHRWELCVYNITLPVVMGGKISTRIPQTAQSPPWVDDETVTWRTGFDVTSLLSLNMRNRWAAKSQ